MAKELQQEDKEDVTINPSEGRQRDLLHRHCGHVQIIIIIKKIFKRLRSAARKKACAFLSVTPIREFAVAEQNNNDNKDSSSAHLPHKVGAQGALQ